MTIALYVVLWLLCGIPTAIICYYGDGKKYDIDGRDFAQMCLMGAAGTMLAILACIQNAGIFKKLAKVKIFKASGK